MLLKTFTATFVAVNFSLWLLITSLKIISRSSRLQTGGVDVEQGGKIVGGLLSQLLKRHPFSTAIYSATSRTSAGWFSLPRWGPAPVRRIGFNQQAIQRHVARRITQLLGVTKVTIPENEI